MQSIAGRFLPFDRLVEIIPIKNGHINDTYRIDAEVERRPVSILLQRINHAIFRQPQFVADNTVRICQHLAASDYPYQIASPIPTLDGAFMYEDEKGQYWRTFHFLENAFPPRDASDPKVAYAAARAYGAFARCLSTFPADTLAETIPGFHDTDRRWTAFQVALETDVAGRVAQAKPEIEAVFAAKPLFDHISRLKRSGDLPLRVAHNDTKADNILFEDGGVKALAVIDLDTVMPGTWLSDFGDMVRTFVPDVREDSPLAPNLNFEILEALKAGYLEETADFMTASEKENLIAGAAWMAGEQAMRFLSDWLAGDVYYKVNSPEHNLIRARNQLELYRRLAMLR